MKSSVFRYVVVGDWHDANDIAAFADQDAAKKFIEVLVDFNKKHDLKFKIVDQQMAIDLDQGQIDAACQLATAIDKLYLSE